MATTMQVLVLVRVGHDPALALIHAPILGAWFYPAVVSAAALLGRTPSAARPAGFLAAGIATALFLEEFLRLDGVWKRLSQSRRDKRAGRREIAPAA